MSSYVLLDGDCLSVLKDLPDASVDSLITDPPAGISFMGKKWDEDKGGRKQWLAWMTEVMSEALRVMKPGAHGLVWAIPRTSHWTATALEDAGFEIRDVVTHLFGSGFPKSLDVSKAIDKAAGAEREILGPNPSLRPNSDGKHCGYSGVQSRSENLTAPATDAAKQWQGWGTALKPASEHWILVRKPCSEKTVAANVLKHSVGGINIDASRITLKPGEVTHGSGANQGNEIYGEYLLERKGIPNITSTQGRFPANLILSHNPDCAGIEAKVTWYDQRDGQGIAKDINGNEYYIDASVLLHPIKAGDKVYLNVNEEITERLCGKNVRRSSCTLGCAVAMLDEQSGVSKGDKRTSKLGGTAPAGNGNTYGHMGVIPLSPNYQDSGGASRFFYCAKAPKSDKGSANTHPTVKNTKLMTYLINMITPPGGVVLDPFMGSGSTGVSAVKSGFKFIGIEKELEYYAICEKRLANAALVEEEVA